MVIVDSLCITLLALVAFTSEATADYCCTFESEDICGWNAIINGPSIFDNSTWQWSGTTAPNLTNHDDFEIDHTSKNYMWLQNTEGCSNATIRSTETVLNKYDVVMLDIYKSGLSDDYDNSTPNPSSTTAPTYDTPLLIIVDTDHGTQNQLALDEDFGWITRVLQCDEYYECCSVYPCNAYFKIVGLVLDETQLLAFDNVQLNGNCLSTTASNQPATEDGKTVTTTTPSTTKTTTTMVRPTPPPN